MGERDHVSEVGRGTGGYVHALTSTYGRQVLGGRGSVFTRDQHASELAGLYCSRSNKYTV